MGQLVEHCWDDAIGANERLIETRFRSERPLGKRPALLMIDCYSKVFGEKREPLAEAIEVYPLSCGTAGWDALPSLERLLKTARQAGVPVLHTTGEARASARLGGATLRDPAEGEDELAGYEIIPPLAPIQGELVAHKGRASAFFDTPMSTWLRQLDVDTVVVAGETTSGCVRASVVDAYSHGFKVAVVEEATFDRSELTHKVNLFDMHLKYAEVIHLEEALAYLTSGRPQEQEK